MNKTIFILEEIEINDAPKAIAKLLSADEPERHDELLIWLHKWFNDEVPGRKLTVVHILEGKAIGVVRF